MGYLQAYDEGGERRERLLKAVAISVAGVAILGFVYFLFFRNWQEERRVKQFLSALRDSQYETAYTYWGCTVAQPCPYYSYDAFLEDWGPESPVGKIHSFTIGRSYEQQSGVIITLQIDGKPRPNLWVEKDTGAVAFSPY